MLNFSFIQNTYLNIENRNFHYEENYKLVASLHENNIRLFADIKSEEKGVYKKFLLDINGKIAILNWKNVTTEAFAPRLILNDINNDGIKELIVILTTGSGSDLHIEEVHVFKLCNISEIRVVNPLDIIKEKVHTSIVNKNDGNVLININLDKTKTEIIKNKNYASHWFENVGFGFEIHWRVSNNKLYANVDSQVSPSGYVGTVVIEYGFKDNIFNLENIRFITY